MKRRLFINKAAAGLLLPFVPVSLTARNALTIPANRESFVTLGTLIQDSPIGTPQQLTITHVYDPEHTALQTLQTRSQQDIALINEALDLAIDARQMVTAISSAAFGSYSAQFKQGTIQVVWQCLARLGTRTSGITSSLLLSGSQGVLQTSLDSLSYQFVDLQGRLVQSNRLTAIV